MKAAELNALRRAAGSGHQKHEQQQRQRRAPHSDRKKQIAAVIKEIVERKVIIQQRAAPRRKIDIAFRRIAVRPFENRIGADPARPAFAGIGGYGAVGTVDHAAEGILRLPDRNVRIRVPAFRAVGEIYGLHGVPDLGLRVFIRQLALKKVPLVTGAHARLIAAIGEAQRADHGAKAEYAAEQKRENPRRVTVQKSVHFLLSSSL